MTGSVASAAVGRAITTVGPARRALAAIALAVDRSSQLFLPIGVAYLLGAAVRAGSRR